VLIPIGFVVLSDPNDFKPQLEKLAEEQGMQLKVDGELNWRIYPNIELEVNRLSLKGEQAGFYLDAAFGMAEFQIELRPLFSGELKINGIRVSDSELSLKELGLEEQELNEEKTVTQQRNEERNSSEASLTATVQQILLQNLNLRYKSTDAVLTVIHVDELGIQQLNLTGIPFPATLKLNYQEEAQKIVFMTDAMASVDLEKRSYSLNTEKMDIGFGLDGEQPLSISMDMDASINLASNQWQASVIQAQLNDLTMKLNAIGQIEPSSARGQVELQGGNQMIGLFSEQTLLGGATLKAGFDYSEERLLANDIVAKVGESNIESSAKYYFRGTKQSELRLDIDRLDLDAYLPTETEEPDSTDNRPLENPLHFLENMQPTNIFASIGELNIKGQAVTEIELTSTITNSEAELHLANALLAEGTIKSDVRLKAIGSPQVSISSFEVGRLNLSRLASQGGNKSSIEGIVNANFTGQIGSLSGDSIIKELDGSGQLDIKNLSLVGTNIEQSICLSAQQLGASAALSDQWAAGTEFEQMTSLYEINKGLLSLNEIGTGFGNIKLGGSGALDLDGMNFDAKFSLRVEGDRTSEQGCSINKYLRNTSLPLSCNGNLSEDGGTSCGLDSSVVTELLKGQIKSELGRQLGRLLGVDESEANGTNDPNKQTEQDSGDQVKDAVKGLLEGLFK